MENWSPWLINERVLRISAHGLMPGWINHDRDGPSIHLHPEDCVGLCLNYIFYVHLFEDGKYVGVLSHVVTMRGGPAINNRRITNRGTKTRQWVTLPGCYHILGCWIHILDQEELVNLYPKQQGPRIDRRWQPDLGLHPNDSDTALFAKSTKKATDRNWVGMWD